jgi:hypothetical protein
LLPKQLGFKSQHDKEIPMAKKPVKKAAKKKGGKKK